MKRRRPHTRQRPSRDAERLAWLAQGLADSHSRLEDTWWQRALDALVEKLLRAGDEDALNQALDRLQDDDGRAYDELADIIEGACESSRNDDFDRLLLALPLLAWSRYEIPARRLPVAALDGLRAQLGAHVLAADARVAFADHLFSPDQLPRGFVDTRRLAESLWQAIEDGRNLEIDEADLPESLAFVSDARYLVAAIRVPAGQPLFRWNEPGGNRRDALTAWSEQGGANLRPVLAGCAFELSSPDAYFAAWRQADQDLRPFSLVSAVAYLQTVFNQPAARLRAVVAPYYENWLVEWRVGFTLADSDDVVHGVSWPLLGGEEENPALGSEIEALLKSAGVGAVSVLDTRMPVEFCDDCGAPLFPSPDGENVHAELPEDMRDAPAHLH